AAERDRISSAMAFPGPIGVGCRRMWGSTVRSFHRPSVSMGVSTVMPAHSPWVMVMSVHHSRIGVVLELDEIVRGVADDEGPVHLGLPVEPGGHVSEDGNLSLDAQPMDGVEVVALSEGHAEMP